MRKKNFEIVVKYSKWEIDILDENGNTLTELKSISKKWFIRNVSGRFFINNTSFDLIYNRNGANIVKDGNRQIGQVTFTSFGTLGYGRSAKIKIEEMNFVFKRQNLKQLFVLTNTNSEQPILTIDGKLYPEKQTNLFGLLYVDDKLFHSVFVNELIDRNQMLLILSICGYCIRFFLEKDCG